MSTNIVDRRNNSRGKSSENRQRLLKRVEDQIKKAIPDIIKNTGIKDLTSSKKGVKVPIKGLGEPRFRYDRDSGDKKNVHPGNKEYTTGDRIKKPENNEGQGSGKKGSKDAENSEDDFTVTISHEEFLDYFFNDLELPDMIKKHLNTIVDWKQKRAGFTNVGNPSRLNIVKSFKNSMARRIAFTLFFDEQISEIERQIKSTKKKADKLKLEEQLENTRNLKNAMCFMEEIDLQYNNFEKIPVPTTSAVMFCIMDISGSMGEKEKDIAKRFFMLLYMFLNKQYEKIDIVFIRHHTSATEVSEEEFFNSRESGGTIVLPAIQLMGKIIEERYSKDWNIYTAQASDGDVWDMHDALECSNLLDEELLNKIQYMIYIEICRGDGGDLWTKYEELSKKKNNLAIGRINSIGEIWDTFKDFFKKKTT